MSQAKVDKHKQEKRNREKNIKKAKLKKALSVLLVAAVVGIIIGFPMGKIMYKNYYEKKMDSATISAELYEYWYQEYWSVNHEDKFYSSDNSQEDISDDELQALADQLSSDTDAIVLTPDQLNPDALQEVIEGASPTDAQ